MIPVQFVIPLTRFPLFFHYLKSENEIIKLIPDREVNNVVSRASHLLRQNISEVALVDSDRQKCKPVTIPASAWEAKVI